MSWATALNNVLCATVFPKHTQVGAKSEKKVKKQMVPLSIEPLIGIS
jgi:hypothetical protein